MVTLRKATRPGDLFRVEGRIVEDPRPGSGARPLMVAAVATFPGRKVVAWRLAQPHDEGRSSAYGVLVGSGDYELLVFDDRDGDGVYRRGDLVGRSGAPELTVGLFTAPDGFTVAGPPLRVDRRAPRDAGFPVEITGAGQGPVVPLTSDFYAAGWGDQGLWRPARFLEHTQGSFLFGVEEYDPSRTLVLFVHGVKGRPPEFAALSGALDRRRFQSWFVYYPSGLPLDKLGAMVADTVAMLSARSPKVVLVAHSMGGLVCRSALSHLTGDPGRGLPAALKGYVSFSSPYGGEPSAAPTGDVPADWPLSFLDVIPSSEFLHDLYARPYPAGVPFHLFYGSLDGQGDGTVPLWSELDPRMRTHAAAEHGFATSHTGILTHPEVLRRFQAVVEGLTAD